MKKKLKVLFVSSEIAPFAKTGGLADVAGALPETIKDEGHEIITVMPKYVQIADEYKEDMKFVMEHDVHLDWRKQKSEVYEYNCKTKNNKKMKCLFIGNDYYFDRWNIYGEGDDGERFAFFSRAVLEMLPKIGFQPDVIHCNDWQTGLISVYLKDQYSDDLFYKDMKTVFSIHNLRFQGNYPADILPLTGLDYSYHNTDKLEFYGGISYMKAGLKYSDIITTVSETYSKEIQMIEYGYGLDGVIRSRNESLYGIVNGVDYGVFNPEADKNIAVKYSKNTIDDKLKNKTELQRKLGLPERDVPVIAMITRLDEQKGIRLVQEVMDQILDMDVQFILLGTGEQYYEDVFRNFAERYPDKMSANIMFASGFAHEIYAGADMFLMPSLYEPCGLSQLYSLKYGTIPVVRRTGGLEDTVKQVTNGASEGSGFTFENYNSWEMLEKIREAVDMFYNRREEWRNVMKRNMDLDFSWTSSAKKYSALYKKLVNNN